MRGEGRWSKIYKQNAAEKNNQEMIKRIEWRICWEGDFISR